MSQEIDFDRGDKIKLPKMKSWETCLYFLILSLENKDMKSETELNDIFIGDWVF
jgi:hypothetical protein